MPERSTVFAVAIAALAIAAAGAVAIYVSQRPQGNQTDGPGPGALPTLATPATQTGPIDPDCATATADAQRLDPLATGEVAAFRVVSQPTSLASLGFARPDGTPVTLADFGGRTLLVNFWATWCVPCRIEMPALDALDGTHGGDEFEVVAISLDRDPPEVPAAFLDEIGIENLDLYVDARMDTLVDIRRAGGMGGLPTTVLVDGAGCLLGIMEGPAEWNSPDGNRLIAAALQGGA
ncbi:MAG: TlpA disulfide reductase family protein [Bauldia sp.]